MEPHPSDRADDLTLLVEAWPRIEQAMLNRAIGGKASFQREESELLVNAVRRALRVEVQAEADALMYVLLFDTDSYDGPHAAKYVTAKRAKVEQLVKRHTPYRIPRRATEARVVASDDPVAGGVCQRLMTSLRGTPWPDPEMPPGWDEGP